MRRDFGAVRGRPAAQAIAALGVIVAALVGGTAGCGKPVLRVADASLGDYYTKKEYESLSEEQREEYCTELANQRDLFLEQIASAEEALQAQRLREEPRRRELDSLRVAADQLEGRLAEARSGAEIAGGDPKNVGAKDDPANAYTVRSGDSLWRIAARGGVYGRGARWTRLYEANRDRIPDPDRIYPGQEIQIPR
ncbi:MAG TPA: LysM peptidoglycan-binding domain-containing protein [Candidatus Eisenbacteria bacterium]|nr:LysM peptidoglycan-binding domain-containing protein [Candidatus Eisenbacteria bacterium]